MNYLQNYKGTIWTNHALKRLKERGIRQEDAWLAWNKPDSKRYAKSEGAWVYYKVWGDEKYEIVSKQNDRGQWLILTVWVKKTDNEKSAKKATKDGLLSKFLKIFTA